MHYFPRMIAMIALLSLAVFYSSNLVQSADKPMPCNVNRPATPDLAIKVLLEGNTRWVSGKQEHPGEDHERRECLFKEGQSPFAAILSCSDSRVPPNLIFDVGPGDLFIARVAGNSTDDLVDQSLGYAVEHLHSEVVLVMGHSLCGAVKGATETYPKSAPYFLSTIYGAVKKAKEIIKQRGGNPNDKAALLTEATDQHVILEVQNLRKKQPFKGLIESGKLKIVGARYDLDTGEVKMLIQ
ncbi:MAG TPA: carbonic anhydrase [Candidatus Binataceae bacterium]|nr:carbonic anhydrase [Candidatus Binataceae bacterium]